MPSLEPLLCLSFLCSPILKKRFRFDFDPCDCFSPSSELLSLSCLLPPKKLLRFGLSKACRFNPLPLDRGVCCGCVLSEGRETFDWPELAYPAAGFRSPNLYLRSPESGYGDWRLLVEDGSLVTPAGVHGLGVPGAEGKGVPDGLASLDGGCESEGPMEKRGVGFGCSETPVACSTEAAVSLDGFSSLGGDVDLCGVTMLGAAWWRIGGTA